MNAHRNKEGGQIPAAQSPRTADRSLTGSTLGAYLILDYLGEGAIGVVYRAERVADGQPAAIKVLKSAVAQHPDMVARFLQQARVVGAVRHPNIVQIHQLEADADRGLVYIVMELLCGQSLAELIADQGPLDAPTVIDLGTQIAEALGALHERRILYRDLKPENLFVVPTATGGQLIKLLDFDLVEPMGNSDVGTVSFLGGTIGTPAYMAPEQVLGRALDVRADVYALGVVLYQMLTGTLPFAAQNLADVLIAHIREPPPPLRLRAAQKGVDVPANLDALVMRCLQKPRTRRFQCITHLRQALERGGIEPSTATTRHAWARRRAAGGGFAIRRSGLPWFVWAARAAGIGVLVLFAALVWLADVADDSASRASRVSRNKASRIQDASTRQLEQKPSRGLHAHPPRDLRIAPPRAFQGQNGP